MVFVYWETATGLANGEWSVVTENRAGDCICATIIGVSQGVIIEEDI